MAEESKNQGFIKFHTMPVEEWESTVGGKDYIKYLEKADARREVDKLSSEEKNDLARLNAFKQGKDGPSEEESYEFDESRVDWTRIDEPTKVVFYLTWPRFMLSETNQHIQGYVKTQWKTKGELAIAKQARKKLEEIAGKSDQQDSKQQESAEKQENEEPENNKEDKKVSLWVRFGKYCKEANDKDQLYRLAVLNSRELADEDQSKKAQSKPAQVQPQNKEGLEEEEALRDNESVFDA